MSLSLLPTLLAAAPALAAQADAETHLAQARLFVRKQWYGDAAQELELAVATPEGATMAEAWWLLAQVRYELLAVEGARDAARTAAAVADSPDQAAQAAAYADWIDASFGVVEIRAPHAGVQSRLQLERQGLLLDPELKRFVERMALEWTHDQVLPLRVMLPAGDYRIQGSAVSAVPGSESVLELPLGMLGRSGFAALQVTRLELSSGVGVMGSQRVDTLRPSWELQVGVTQPVGDWLAGLVLDYSLRAYQVPGYGPVRQPHALALGARVGRELMVAGPLALRPALGYRYGYLPGVPLACSRQDGLVCTAPAQTESPEVLIYAVGRAHFVYGEINVDWRRAGRTNATGVGVRVAVDRAFGSLPEQGQAEYLGSPGSVDYSVDGTRWGATSLRLMANFSHAF
ncbi:MAG: hypothetical protein VX899_25505 [Myxococcota bacterium]|nr:hypothetical protein [Myxococcota bacterium]